MLTVFLLYNLRTPFLSFLSRRRDSVNSVHFYQFQEWMRCEPAWPCSEMISCFATVSDSTITTQAVTVCAREQSIISEGAADGLFPASVRNEHTYLLIPWRRVLLENLSGLQLVKKFPAFHGTRRFITALTSFRHLSVSWASPIQSIYPHPTSWRSILILSTHLRLGLPSGLLPSGFPAKTLYNPLSSPIRATCPIHLILLDFITRTVLSEEYKS